MGSSVKFMELSDLIGRLRSEVIRHFRDFNLE